MSQNGGALISIICCTHNREGYVRNHFEFLVPRLPPRTELIYALDHCSDGTLDYLSKGARGDERIKVLENSSEPGLFSCRNFALDHAKGQYIHFLDDDDSVSENFYGVLVEFIENQGDADLLIGGLIINRDGKERENKEIVDRSAIQTVKRGSCEYFGGDMFSSILKGRVYFNSANALIRAGLFDKYRFHSEIRKTADWLFYLEISLKEKLSAVYIPAVYALYYVHSGSMSIAPDKIYWNMRIFKLLYEMAPTNHESFADIRLSYGKSIFDAGYAIRTQSKRSALSYYLKSCFFGFPLLSIKAILKLLVPTAVLLRQKP